jgi:MinD superfamily P-loop ATPase
MNIAIASGKGGTGKTFVATNLAAVLGAAYVDADVEGANGHLFLKPAGLRVRPAEIEVPEATDACPPRRACNGCGACAKVCRFGALAALKTGVLVFNELCHSCGACLEVCPTGALRWTRHVLGRVRVGTYRACPAQPWRSGDGGGPARPFADGELAIGQVRSVVVIRQVKEAVGASADTVVDCPPGASCAVTEAVRGADLCLLVTEPTPFGLADLDKALALARHLGVPAAVLVNRSDLTALDVEAHCRERGAPVISQFPYDPDVARMYAEGRLAVGERGRWREAFESLARRLRAATGRSPQPGEGYGGLPPAARSTPPGQPDAADSTRGADRASPQPSPAAQVAVISGKGGTGKTSLAASLAVIARRAVAADADVDAANLHLLLKVADERSADFSGGYVAAVDAAKCRGCGVCAGACRFEAITLGPHAIVDPLKCEGCGVCALVCPLAGTEEMPARLVARLSGHAYVGDLPNGWLARGELLAGGEASGKLVTLVRRMAEERAADADGAPILLDASPGTGCPVNASLTGCDLAIAVTEPTQSGLHDLARALDLAAWFKVPAVVVINKADLCPEVAAGIRRLAADRGVEVIGEVPFDRRLPEDLARGIVPAMGDGQAARALRRVCLEVLDRLGRCARRRGDEVPAKAPGGRGGAAEVGP